MTIRTYQDDDYEAVKALFEDESTFGGQFDPDRDSSARLATLAHDKPDCLLVAEVDGDVRGTVTLFEDGRTAWLFRFAVKEGDQAVTHALYQKMVEHAKARGHQQVLVYAPVGNEGFAERYQALGFTKGGDYTCFWQEF